MIGFAFYKPYLAVNFAGMHLLCEVLETAALPTWWILWSEEFESFDREITCSDDIKLSAGTVMKWPLSTRAWALAPCWPVAGSRPGGPISALGRVWLALLAGNVRAPFTAPFMPRPILSSVLLPISCYWGRTDLQRLIFSSQAPSVVISPLILFH